MRFLVWIGLCAVLGACATNPERATTIATPKTPINKTRTNFSEALRCMDDLLLASGKRSPAGQTFIAITSDQIPDLTGKIQVGAKEMLKTALARMSTKSQAMRYIEVGNDPNLGLSTAQLVRAMKGQGQGLLPDFIIEGAITQVDQNVARDGAGGGIGTPWATLGYSEDQLLSIVSVDMRLANADTGTYVPGVFTTNTITVVSTGSSSDAEGVIDKGAVFIEVSQSRNEGTHQSVRTLMELSAIEIIGKFTKVPYWRCLEIEATNPLVFEQARDWYDVLGPSERVEVVQAAMVEGGLYGGPVTGSFTPEFREAVNRYKATRDLTADGRIDFDLYYQLLVENRAVAPAQMADSGRRTRRTLGGDVINAVASGPADGPPQPFDVDGTSGRPAGSTFQGLEVAMRGGTRKRISAGSALTFEISVERPSEVYCYYRFPDPARGVFSVVKVFPNRWQQNNSLAPGQSVMVPGNGAGFDLRPATAGFEEELTCVAKEGGYNADTIPDFARAPDLTPLPVPVLDAVVYSHQQADALQTAIRSVTWTVQ